MITFLGPVVDGEQMFATVFYFEERWIILQDGVIGGKTPDIWTYIYDPAYVGDPILFLEGEVVVIYSHIGDYIVNCSLDAWDLLEEVPCPQWAVACRLD